MRTNDKHSHSRVSLCAITPSIARCFGHDRNRNGVLVVFVGVARVTICDPITLIARVARENSVALTTFFFDAHGLRCYSGNEWSIVS
jgi:hypothetical protein